jgi:drug/metabolite transporter (DMT)-like permease
LNINTAFVNWVLLFGLVALWGTSFAATAISVETIPPVSTAFFRLAIGALVLLIAVFASGQRLPLSWKAWLAFTIMGIVGNALPFFLISWGQQSVPSGVAGTIMAVMPLMTMIFAHYFTDDEKLNRFKMIGFTFGIGGVTLLMGPVFEGGGQALVGAMAIFIAATSYAANAILVRRLPRFSPLVGACGVLIMASLTMLPFWLWHGATDIEATQASTISVIWLGFGPTGLATILLFTVIGRAGPTFLATINYLIPVVAFFCGAWLLSEPVYWLHYLALLTILGGIALTRIKPAVAPR